MVRVPEKAVFLYGETRGVHADRPSAALVFVNVDHTPISGDDIEHILTEPTVVRRLFEPYVVGHVLRGFPHVLVVHHRVLNRPYRVEDNKRWKEYEPTEFYISNGKDIQRIVVEDVVSSCTDLRALLLCDGCPKTKTQCVFDMVRDSVEGAESENPLKIDKKFAQHVVNVPERWFSSKFEEQHNIRYSDWKDIFHPFKYHENKVGEYVCTPVYSGEVRVSFTSITRTRLSDVLELTAGNRLTQIMDGYSIRSRKSAATRKTKKNECAHCTLSADCGNPYRCKHGKWSEEALEKRSLELYKEMLTNTGITLRQADQITALSGHSFYTNEFNIHGTRYLYDIRGLAAKGAGITLSPTYKIELQRRTIAPFGNRRTVSLDDVKELLDVLPDKLKKFFEIAPEIPDNVRALIAQASVLRNTPSYICMRGSIREVTPQIYAVYPCGERWITIWSRLKKRKFRYNIFSMTEMFNLHHMMPLFAQLEETASMRKLFYV